jgi:hypothetical protein
MTLRGSLITGGWRRLDPVEELEEELEEEW